MLGRSHTTLPLPLPDPTFRFESQRSSNVIHVAWQPERRHMFPPRNSTPASRIGPGHHRLHRERIIPSANFTVRVPQKPFRSKSYATLAKVNTKYSLRSPLDWSITCKIQETSIEKYPNKCFGTKSQSTYPAPLAIPSRL